MIFGRQQPGSATVARLVITDPRGARRRSPVLDIGERGVASGEASGDGRRPDQAAAARGLRSAMKRARLPTVSQPAFDDEMNQGASSM